MMGYLETLQLVQWVAGELLEISGGHSYAEAIGAHVGRGWQRANPPLGLVGRRCEWTEDDETQAGTIRSVYEDSDGAYVWIEQAGGQLHQYHTSLIRLLPWMADETAAPEVTP
jgi:hypothetical protein